MKTKDIIILSIVYATILMVIKALLGHEGELTVGLVMILTLLNKGKEL